jgi:dihydroorotate dehydrogenase
MGENLFMSLAVSYLGKKFENPFVLASGTPTAKADMIELNFSCPHGCPEKGKGAAIGQSAEYSASIVEIFLV